MLLSKTVISTIGLFVNMIVMCMLMYYNLSSSKPSDKTSSKRYFGDVLSQVLSIPSVVRIVLSFA